MVFGVLVVECGLLLELVLLRARAMPSLYSCLQGCVHTYCNAIAVWLMIVLVQSRHVPSDTISHIAVGYRVHADDVFIHHATGKNQAIHHMI
jgi:hypothetical protein